MKLNENWSARHYFISRILVLIALLQVGGCYSIKDYRGDGVMEVSGWIYFNKIHELKLAHIDFHSDKSYRYEMKNLPAKRMMIALQVPRSASVDGKKKSSIYLLFG